MHDRAASKIQRRKTTTQRRIQQATLTPHHMRHGIVHHERPEHHEQQHGAKFHALGKGSRDQGRRYDGKHQLIDHEGLLRDRGRVGRVGRQAYPAQE